jgi:nitrite reductase/ring-hydroxylating ferredoxin subunit
MKRLLTIALIFAFVGCSDDFTDYGYVNFYVEPDSTLEFNLNLGARGWEYFEGGYRGVVVFRNSAEEFRAYERSCTLEGCHGRLKVDETTNVIVHCPNCSSDFLSYDGSPLSGSKAKRMLYGYCTFYDGERLWVNNCR